MPASFVVLYVQAIDDERKITQKFVLRKEDMDRKRQRIAEGKAKEIKAGEEAKEARLDLKKNIVELDRMLEREEEDFLLVYKQLNHIIETSAKSDKTQEMYRRKRKEHVSFIAIWQLGL
jgi:hypothetical protein